MSTAQRTVADAGRPNAAPGRSRRWAGRVVLVAAMTPAAFGHGASDLTPATWARAWSWEPGIVASLFVAAALYATGLHDLRVATGIRHKLRRQAFHFWSGWTVLVVALVSPIHPLGQVLFSAHMVQHELLMVAAAPLLVLGRPARVWLWALPRAAAKRLGGLARTWDTTAVGRYAASPFVAFLAHAAAL